MKIMKRAGHTGNEKPDQEGGTADCRVNQCW